MKTFLFYVALFIVVFLLTYSVAPLIMTGAAPSDQIIQTPFSDYNGLIRS